MASLAIVNKKKKKLVAIYDNTSSSIVPAYVAQAVGAAISLRHKETYQYVDKHREDVWPVGRWDTPTFAPPLEALLIVPTRR